VPTPQLLAESSGPVDLPLLSQTIGDCLRERATLDPEREALVVVDQGVRLSYGELDAAVDELALALLAAGLQPGDRVALWAPNCAEWMLLQYATARVGAILVCVNPAYRAHELRFVLGQSGSRLLVSAPAFKGSDYRAMVAEVRADLPTLERVVFLGEDWEALRREGAAVPVEMMRARAAGLRDTDKINIQYTSGTTGFPKGATLTHRNILNNGREVGRISGYTAADRVCVPVPFYHCFGMVMGNLAALAWGACVVVPAAAFDPVATLRAIEAERCTSLYGVPTMFIAELACPELPGVDLSSLRTGIMAGSPCPVEVMKRVVTEMHMTEVTICYGMTETSPVSTQTRADDDLERRVSTVGRVHPHLTVRVVDPQSGAVLPRGVPGELCTRGYSVMTGYWQEPEMTAEAIDGEGFMHTGDLAVMDPDGYLAIVGRIKDLVIRGGENVYPREVEEFLYTHPDVVDVQVIGVPDATYGEELCAWVVLRGGSSLEAEELRAWCRGRLAHYKVPRYVRMTDTFPMTVTGKVQKYKMRETSVAELGLA